MSSDKKFVTEGEIAENKVRLQQAWDATRGPDDPQTAPEPAHDTRTLFQRLEDNRVKKEEEYEEAHRLKNLVKGLEDDDVEFLSAVDRKRLEEERKVKEAERIELEEFRKRRAEMDFAATTAAVKAKPTAGLASKGSMTSQKALLLGAVKRKVSGDGEASKRSRTDSSSGNEQASKENKSDVTNKLQSNGHAKDVGNLKVIAVLPGMGNYTDSSASSTSSDSEPDHHNIALRTVFRRKKSKKNSGCC